MNSQISQGFEIATWYDTWNPVGLNNLVNNLVPLHLASRYSLAFGQLSAIHSGGYCIEMSGKYADAIKDQLLSQAPGIELYAGIGSEGIQASVASNKSDNNLSTRNIVSWLKDNHYTGINIDAEEREAMKQVAEFVTQLGPEFRAAGLGIAVSVPWPGEGPSYLYGEGAIQAFNDNVDAVEMQDYSSINTARDAAVWLDAGLKAEILMGGVCSENSRVQTPLEQVEQWTEFAIHNGLRGMFSWRLDNDHGSDGTREDVGPSFACAKRLYDTLMKNR
ncbi:hypothetical protein [Shewanella algae]|uniref:hypothetical protein n=1 Tax=Shewanella algae TaxID=38313 RepID=UPI00118368B0|nr:hypothetical protein [Shewanella algae]MBO2555963.1 hypothetical protein [Shewanella algae]MBO2572896.1 hypothetical protein [Shewanella algae]MBO2661737.1 hypothetical protein [Shewanella algae]MCL1052917.1 hypothetical protein [Shewanella algae]TVL36752.1 hypothetical protein AYI94_12235 [Shewanella algae]